MIGLFAYLLDVMYVLLLFLLGHGVRTNILRRCSKLVKIGSTGEESERHQSEEVFEGAQTPFQRHTLG